MNDRKLTTITAPLPPTSRLVLLACAGSATPLSIGNLTELTGPTPGTLEKAVRKLRKHGYLAQTSTGFQHLCGLAPQIAKG